MTDEERMAGVIRRLRVFDALQHTKMDEVEWISFVYWIDVSTAVKLVAEARRRMSAAGEKEVA